MNNKRRKAIKEAFDIISSETMAERDSLDTQEEYFGETERWQMADEACDMLENAVSELEDVTEGW